MKNKPTASLGKLGTQFFALMQMKGLEILHLGETQEWLGLSARQERDLLSTLDKKGFIIRLKRGVYLIPKKIPPGGYWQPSSYYLISQFMKIMEAKYYIGGTNAMHHHGLTEQVPNTMTIYNDKISGRRNIGSLTVFFTKTDPKKICALDHFTIPQGHTIPVSNLAHTLIDLVKYWKKHNAIDIAYNYIKNRKDDQKLLKQLIKTVIQCGNTGTKRRVGYYIYKLTNDKRLIAGLLKSLPSTKSWTHLFPNTKPRGTTIEIWGIIDNEK